MELHKNMLAALINYENALDLAGKYVKSLSPRNAGLGWPAAESITRIESIVDGLKTGVKSSRKVGGLNNGMGLFKEASSLLLKYIAKYDVKVKRIDQYKCTHFLGVQILIYIHGNLGWGNYLDGAGIRRSDAWIVASIALVYSMNNLLQVELGHGIPDDIKDKILKSITDDKGKGHGWLELFGIYGLYLMFKIIQKQCTSCAIKASQPSPQTPD